MTIGAAVVGLGVGEQHARVYADSVHSRLLVVCDQDGAKARRVAAELGAETSERVEDVLANPAVQLVSLATFDHEHASQVVAALEAGKHVFCEKPLCHTLEELRAIKRASDARPHLRLGANLVLRGAPLYQWLERSASELGEIFSFSGEYLYGRLSKLTEGWRQDVPDYSVMLGGGIHIVDLMMGLLGRPKSVHAAGNRIATTGTKFRFHDFSHAVFRFPNGAIGTVTANFGCVHRHQHVVRVFGTRGTFIYDDQGARIYRARDPGDPPSWRQESPLPPGKGVLIPAFLASIAAPAAGAGAPGRAEQGEFDLMAACIAAHRSDSSGREEEIEYV